MNAKRFALASLLSAALLALFADPVAAQEGPPTRARVRAAVAAWEARGLPDGTLVRFDAHPSAPSHVHPDGAGWRVEVEVEARRGRAVARATAGAQVP